MYVKVIGSRSWGKKRVCMSGLLAICLQLKGKYGYHKLGFRFSHVQVLYVVNRVGNFYPHVVLTMVKTLVKTGLGKTTKTHISWAKLISDFREKFTWVNAN